MREDGAQHRANEFVKELYAAGSIDAAHLDTGVARLLAAQTETEPGLPLIRLDVTTNIGRVHLRHPRARSRTRPPVAFQATMTPARPAFD